MHDIINRFIRDILAQKNMTGVDPEIMEQLVQNMSEKLNDEINRAIIGQLNSKQLGRFEKLISSDTDTNHVQDFLSKTDADTTKTAANVMTAFRKGYLGA